MDNIFHINSGVTELVASDFKVEKGKKPVIKHSHFKSKPGFIIFYAPWCIHCVNSRKKWIDLSLIFGNKYKFGAVNAENSYARNRTLLKHFKVEGFPTIKYVSPRGIVSDYNGSYEMDDLVDFICKKLDTCGTIIT